MTPEQTEQIARRREREIELLAQGNTRRQVAEKLVAERLVPDADNDSRTHEQKVDAAYSLLRKDLKAIQKNTPTKLPREVVSVLFDEKADLVYKLALAKFGSKTIDERLKPMYLKIALEANRDWAQANGVNIRPRYAIAEVDDPTKVDPAIEAMRIINEKRKERQRLAAMGVKPDAATTAGSADERPN